MRLHVPYRDQNSVVHGAFALALDAMRTSIGRDYAGERYRHALTLARLSGTSKRRLAEYARAVREDGLR